jgi:hypothetical protein
VQIANFGRVLTGSSDALPGFTRDMVEIADPDVVAKSGSKFHPIITKTSDPNSEVPGTLFLITEAELLAADTYEVSDYKTIKVVLKSGKNAWVYVKA